jgi:hypothetical protein
MQHTRQEHEKPYAIKAATHNRIGINIIHNKTKASHGVAAHASYNDNINSMDMQ